MRNIFSLLVAAIAVLSGAATLKPQEPELASVRITLPKDNTVFHPGDTVRVEIAAEANFVPAMLIGQDPLGFHRVVPTSDGYRSSLTIPGNISPGKYTLTVLAQKNVPGARPGLALPVTIDIERFDRLLSVSISPDALQLQVGDEVGLTVEGIYADGSQVELSHSTQTSFVSESPSIATVTRDGLVTGIGVGSTRIRIRGKFVVPVTVKPRGSR